MGDAAIRQWNFGLFVLYAIAAAAVLIVCLYFLLRKTHHKVLPGASWQQYSSFQQSIKSGGSVPEKIIPYGKTYFKYDEAGRKIFIQSAKTPNGIMINSDDLASVNIYCDGKAVEPEDVDPEPDFSALRHTQRSCCDMHITISRKDGSEIILPLIDSPTQYEYIYTRALEVANDITAILKEIINKRNR